MRAAALAVLLAGCSQAMEDEPPDASTDFADAPFIPDRPDARPPVDAAPPDADPPPRYAADRTSPLSPITPSVGRNLEAIALRGATLKDDVFAKVGDSITVATPFLHCYASTNVDLDGRTHLTGTLEHFKSGDAAGKDPFQRISAAAKVGWSARAVITGSPTPLEDEVGQIMPRYALVMFGSNDAAQTPDYVFTFGPILLDIVDRLAALGVVPIMSTVPPNTQDPAVGARIPRFNEVIRGVAQARQLPLMDYGREMLKLPSLGLGADGLHPNSFPAGACVLTADGLRHGYNLRNLLALQSLHRARSVVEGDPPPDPPAAVPAAPGAGSYDEPFLVNSFPWSDMRDTSRSPHTMLTQYNGGTCNALQNESGPEYVYRLDLTREVTVRAMVLDGAAVDVDLHLMSGLTPETCIQRHDREIVRTLSPGTYYFVLDTFVPMASGMPQAGEYLFVVMEEEAP